MYGFFCIVNAQLGAPLLRCPIKDARSVSLYPYNKSQIFQYVKTTKLINIVKEIANFCDK